MLNKKVFTVQELNTYLKNLIENDGRLNNVWVKGEISNGKLHSSGHFYFVLKDTASSVRCVMFRSRAGLLNFSPQNGIKVIVRGYISIYEREGSYQLYAEEIHPDGLGELYLAFEQLKKKLELEGLFDPIRKRRLPKLPRKIGIVTSATGAVWQDIQKVVFRRLPNAQLVLAPAAVQGDAAPKEIADGIRTLNSIDGVDAIIVGRGGGSLEELWAFNTEQVARAIYESRVPIISAVGHETDYTIADFVADVRAATPSVAAEMVVPVKHDVERILDISHSRLEKLYSYRITLLRQHIERLGKSYVFTSPYKLIQQKQQYIDTLAANIGKGTEALLRDKRNRLNSLAEMLNVLSPLTTLTRGYAICRDKNRQVISSVSQVKPGDKIDVLLKDGTAFCEINDIREGETSQNE